MVHLVVSEYRLLSVVPRQHLKSNRRPLGHEAEIPIGFKLSPKCV